MSMRIAVVLVIFLIAALGCTPATSAFPMSVRGRLDSRVEFLFFRNAMPLTVRVNEVRVYSEDKQEGAVWKLEGEAEVNTLVYGRTPEGLRTVTHKPLRRGGAYQGVVFTNVGTRNAGEAFCRFVVNEEGIVVAEMSCK